jgi:hypothetical protein
VALALRYGRPVVAFLGSRDEIPDLPAAVRAEGDLEQVKDFVREKLGAVEKLQEAGHSSSVE